jgi:hypothetical protein
MVASSRCLRSASKLTSCSSGKNSAPSRSPTYRNCSEPTILGLKTVVGRLGIAQLDDRVVKSGRTSGVTFGMVTRVEVITKMNYGQGVTASIGGFEIGIDPRNRPSTGEISQGGDSGSCWMAIETGTRATDIMLGLHFGDAEDSDDEFRPRVQRNGGLRKA